MDYKYIEQLLERYWQCETTLEEERILKAFFSQKDVPAGLIQYQSLFAYEQSLVEEEKLGEDFDRKILAEIGEPMPVKARTLTLRQRLMPLFRAAAIVAIILTLGNALQVPFRHYHDEQTVPMADDYRKIHNGPSVAKSDSLKTDSLHSVQADIITAE